VDRGPDRSKTRTRPDQTGKDPNRTGPDQGKRTREEGRKMARLTCAIRHDRATYFTENGQAVSACGMGINLARSDRVIRDHANMSTKKKKIQFDPPFKPGPDRRPNNGKAWTEGWTEVGPFGPVLSTSVPGSVRSGTEY